MIVASGELQGVKVMMDLCQRVLDGRGMLDEWKTSVTVPIFKGKGHVMSCGSYRGMKLLEHAMKIVKRVPDKRIRTLVNLNEMQFGFMPGKGTVNEKRKRIILHYEKNAGGILKEGSVLSLLLFAIAVDVITENARRGLVNELLYADDLALMNKAMKDLKERFWNWKDALESKGLKAKDRKTKVMVSGS